MASKLPYVIGGIGLAGGIGIALYFLTRKDEPTVAPTIIEPSAAPPPPRRPPMAVPSRYGDCVKTGMQTHWSGVSAVVQRNIDRLKVMGYTSIQRFPTGVIYNEGTKSQSAEHMLYACKPGKSAKAEAEVLMAQMKANREKAAEFNRQQRLRREQTWKRVVEEAATKKTICISMNLAPTVQAAEAIKKDPRFKGWVEKKQPLMASVYAAMTTHGLGSKMLPWSSIFTVKFLCPPGVNPPPPRQPKILYPKTLKGELSGVF